MYQRRWGKGGLFMACILSTFFFGLYLGDGKGVHAPVRDGEVEVIRVTDKHWRSRYVGAARYVRGD